NAPRARRSNPIRYLSGMKTFIRLPESRLEWIWRWRWSRKITVRAWLCRLRGIWCSICVGPVAQSQFSAALSLQLTDRKPLRELEAWVLDNLHKPLTVSLLAERVAMSPRNFARVFTKEMKTTPAKFVERLRVEAARRRLEESHNSMETIAGECGFGNV